MSYLAEFKKSVSEAMEAYEINWNARDTEDSTRQRATEEQLREIFSKIQGARHDNSMFYNGRNHITGWLPKEFSAPNEGANVEVVYNYMLNNKLPMTLWLALFSAVSDEMARLYGVNMRWNYIITNYDEASQTNDMNVLESMNFYKMMVTFRDAVITKDNLLYAVRMYKTYLHEFKMNVERRNEQVHKKTEGETGISKVFKNRPHENHNLIEEQLQEAIKQMPSNGLTARTWGFEIEVPDAKGVEPVLGCGIEKGDDGSLRSYEAGDECDCGCSSCTYHDCNCDNCSDYNDDPQHCGDSDCATADSAEFRTTGGIQKMKHSGMYKLCEELNEKNAEMNDTAGTHIHVYAGDLTTHQVGQVMAIYTYIENFMTTIAGRHGVNYAGAMRVDHVAKALKRRNPGLVAVKPLAVNVSHLFGSRGTIEFRQMDCNLNADRITFWAWLVRGLVEVAKRGATLGDFKKVEDLNDVIKVLQVWNFTIQTENPDKIVYGSKADARMFKVQTHNQLS